MYLPSFLGRAEIGGLKSISRNLLLLSRRGKPLWQRRTRQAVERLRVLREAVGEAPIYVTHPQEAPQLGLRLGELGLPDGFQVLLIDADTSGPNYKAKVLHLVTEEVAPFCLKRDVCAAQ